MAGFTMTRDEITRMAREAGFFNAQGGLTDNGELSDYWDCWPNQLERFFHAAYAAGAAAERKAIEPIVFGLCISDNNAQEIVTAIRKRGQE